MHALAIDARAWTAFQHARVLKFIATLIAIVVLIVVMIGAFYVLRKNPRLLGR